MLSIYCILLALVDARIRRIRMAFLISFQKELLFTVFCISVLCAATLAMQPANNVDKNGDLETRIRNLENILLPGCKKAHPLGMENRHIGDNQISASSIWRHDHRASNGRLNFKAGGGRTGAWSSRHNDQNQWFKVDLGRSTIITGISTQGRQDATQFVTSYTISSSDSGYYYRKYKLSGVERIFLGNQDRNTIVQHFFTPSIRARFIRVHPTGWYGHISMRVEFYGCFN